MSAYIILRILFWLSLGYISAYALLWLIVVLYTVWYMSNGGL